MIIRLEDPTGQQTKAVLEVDQPIAVDIAVWRGRPFRRVTALVSPPGEATYRECPSYWCVEERVLDPDAVGEVVVQVIETVAGVVRVIGRVLSALA